MAKEIYTLSTNNYEERIVIFIDLIGFSEHVEKNKDDEKSIIDFLEYFKNQVSEGRLELNFSEPSGSEKLIKNHVLMPSFNFFSDTIILTLPIFLVNPKDDLFKGFPFDVAKSALLFKLTVLASDIQLHALKYGLLTRGCMTIGNVYNNQSMWFGPALIEAHYYESKIANYPRVILSEKFLSFFKNEIDHSNSQCEMDFDGFYFIDYLGWIHTKFSDDFCEAHHEVRGLIATNIEELKEQKYKLQKWQWLAQRFNSDIEKLKKHHGEKLANPINL